MTAHRLGDLAEGDALVGDRVQDRAGGSGLDGQADQTSDTDFILVPDAAEAVELLPHGQLAVLPGTKHMDMTRSELVAPVVEAFPRGVTPAYDGWIERGRDEGRRGDRPVRLTRV